MLGIYFFTYLRQTKAAYPAIRPTLCIPISYSSKPYLANKLTPAGDWYNNCCLRYIFLEHIDYSLTFLK
jgi:hypothetical protein